MPCWSTHRFGEGSSRVGPAPGLLERCALLDEDGAILTHPAVVSELVLGGLSSHHETLMRRLPSAPEVSNEEVMALIRHRRLARRGVGWVDCHLLASALVAAAALWSADTKLSELAEDLGVAFAVPPPS